MIQYVKELFSSTCVEYSLRLRKLFYKSARLVSLLGISILLY
nr:MAG TPA: hypothetical protein [Bacteriophage sp.]